MGKIKLSRSFRCEGYNETEKISHNNREFVAKLSFVYNEFSKCPCCSY